MKLWYKSSISSTQRNNKKISHQPVPKHHPSLSYSPLLLSEISDTLSYCHYVISVLAVEISKFSHPHTVVMMSYYQTWELKYSGKWHLLIGEEFATVSRTVVLLLQGPATFQTITVYLSLGSSWTAWPQTWQDCNLSKCLERLTQQHSFTSQKNLKFRTPKFLVCWFSENIIIFTAVTWTKLQSLQTKISDGFKSKKQYVHTTNCAQCTQWAGTHVSTKQF